VIAFHFVRGKRKCDIRKKWTSENKTNTEKIILSLGRKRRSEENYSWAKFKKSNSKNKKKPYTTTTPPEE